MIDISPPKKSKIEIRTERDGTLIRWKKPSGGLMRYFLVFFLIFWLCGWTVGIFSAAAEFLNEKNSDSFSVFFVVFGAVFEVIVILMLYLLLRPQIPESVKLGDSQFEYDTGTSPPVGFINPFWMMQQRKNLNPLAPFFQRRKIYRFLKWEMPDVVLEGMGDDQRLRFDDGADRVVVGECLTEPEREWLARIIQDWLKG